MAETDQCRRQLPILQRQPVAPGFGVPDDVDLSYSTIYCTG